MQKWIKEVGRGKRGAKDLNYEESRQAAAEIVSGQATDAQIAAFFMAERIKMETPEELLGFIHEYRENTKRLPIKTSGLLDCGGPYNGRNTFAATIPVSILLSEQGLPVMLHASESLPPKNGTSLKTILEKLSIPIGVNVSELQLALKHGGAAFAWSDHFCPSLANLRRIRKEIGVRTMMNTVEKLLDIGNASYIILGVFHRTAVNKIIPSLQKLNYEKAFIVQGVEGSEDLPVHRSSFIYKITADTHKSVIIDPEEFGLKHSKEVNKEILSADQQSSIIQRVLSGDDASELSAYRAQVVLNAGVRYCLLGHTSTIGEGTALADQQLKEGAGERHLSLWQQKVFQ